MKNLKELRTLIGFTQIEVAIKIGVSLTTYRMWEMGVTKPNEENQKKLNELFGEIGE